MRRLRLLTALTTPDGELPPGEEIVVTEADAAVLLGAIGLATDLGPAGDAPDKPARKAR